MNLHTMYSEALTVYDKEIKIVTIIKPFYLLYGVTIIENLDFMTVATI